MKFHKLLDSLSPLKMLAFPKGCIAQTDFRIEIYSGKYRNRLSSAHIFCIKDKLIPGDAANSLYATTGIDYSVSFIKKGEANPTIKIRTVYDSNSRYILTPEQYRRYDLNKLYSMPSVEEMLGESAPVTHTGRRTMRKIKLKPLGKKVNGWNAIDLFDLFRLADMHYDHKLIETAEFVPFPFEGVFFIEKNDVYKGLYDTLHNRMPQEEFTRVFGKEERFADYNELIKYIISYSSMKELENVFFDFLYSRYDYIDKKLVRKEDVILYDE